MEKENKIAARQFLIWIAKQRLANSGRKDRGRYFLDVLRNDLIAARYINQGKPVPASQVYCERDINGKRIA